MHISFTFVFLTANLSAPTARILQSYDLDDECIFYREGNGHRVQKGHALKDMDEQDVR